MGKFNCNRDKEFLFKIKKPLGDNYILVTKQFERKKQINK